MAAAKLLLLIGFIHPIQSLVLFSNDTTNHMERSFNPTEQDRAIFTAATMRDMTLDSALRMLENDKQVPSTFMASVETVLASSGRSKRTMRGTARSNQEPDTSSTKKMLNDMIYQSLKKYDLEQAKCSNYYAKQCAEMESTRDEISQAAGQGAACKGKTLSAQGGVAEANKQLPKLQLHLAQQETNCEKEVNATKKHLSRIMGDITVMTSILKMTDCKKGLVQTKKLGLLHCKTECAAKPFVSFEDHALREKVNELKSSLAHQALQDVFSDFSTTSAAGPILELAQDGTLQEPKKKKVEKAKLPRKPVPRMEKPVDPCEDPIKAAMPGGGGKRAGKCTMSDNPNCAKTQSRFLLIQAGMMDERDNLKEQLSDLDQRCELAHKTKSSQVEQEEAKLKDEQTKLAEATSCESAASEKGRMVAEAYKEQQSDMAKMQGTCQTNFQSLLTEQCGLKKVRGEVLKLSGVSDVLQDCSLGNWEPGQCSKKCGGGSLILTRSVMMPENGGVKCLPLQQNRSCNDGPCPVNCKVASWSKFSRCSADCGGGVSQRARDVEVHMRYGGKPCGA
jgi:hypothetical protein